MEKINDMLEKGDKSFSEVPSPSVSGHSKKKPPAQRHLPRSRNNKENAAEHYYTKLSKLLKAESNLIPSENEKIKDPVFLASYFTFFSDFQFPDINTEKGKNKKPNIITNLLQRDSNDVITVFLGQCSEVLEKASSLKILRILQ